MPLPNVLIIGAMKAGTTSLYMDIADRRGAFLAQDKEPHALCHDDVLSPTGRASYEAKYEQAPAGALCCDASTGYAKRPDFDGVVERAIRVLPAGFKAIYVVRHPIERIISQHHHEHTEGLVGPSIDEEVRRHGRYVQYSRYAYQLEPWMEQLGPERIRVVRFEDYVSRRRETVRDLLGFVGLPAEDEAESAGRVYNKSQGKPVTSPRWEALRQSGAYRRWLRPLAPPKLRLALQRLILPKATAQLAPPSEQTLSFLRDALRGDVSQLERTFGRSFEWSGFETASPASVG
ncbi:MAG: hypothetical protein C0485_11085 [Pirellula sp.]|nr:hypothetical protein [Pirellula sp.]